jgi:adenylylsulfate kinase-like enzyme
VRKQIETVGNFVEIYISTPLELCEKRDVKGLYNKARMGLLKNFTGIDDPYEAPLNPELTFDTSTSVKETVMTIIKYLQNRGFIENIAFNSNL